MKPCPVCSGIGFTTDLDGDGYMSEVICGNCDGTGTIDDPDDPDHERDIIEDISRLFLQMLR